MFNRKLRRSEVLRFFDKLPACLLGMEACGSAHYWAREITAPGHEVRLIPPAYVKPFVKRGKTDAADAEAISEAVTRKTTRFGPIKTAEQQAAAMVLKTRTLLVRRRTQAVNALRAHLAELGIIATLGLAKVEAQVAIVRDETDARLPAAARFALMAIADETEASADQIERLERAIIKEAKNDEDMRRLTTIPGPHTAATIKALVPDPGGFKARYFAAWLGIDATIGVRLDYPQGGDALGVAAYGCQAGIDDEPPAVLHQGMAEKGQLCLHARALAIELGVRIGGAGMRRVGTRRAAKIALDVAPARRWWRIVRAIVAQNTTRRSAVDARTTHHPGSSDQVTLANIPLRV
jgi:hypothetical protein